MHDRKGVRETQGGTGSDKKVRSISIALLAAAVLLALGIFFRPAGRCVSIVPSLTGTDGQENPTSSRQVMDSRSPSPPEDSGVPMDNRVMGQTDATLPQTALGGEAAYQAMEFFYPTTIGESNYVPHIQTYRDPMYPDKGRTVFEVRNLNVDVDPSEVTEADTRNGIEWHGYAKIVAGPARSYVLSHLPSLGFMKGTDLATPAPDGARSPWTDSITFSVVLEKTKGKWSIGLAPVPDDSVWGQDTIFERASPPDIPDYPP